MKKIKQITSFESEFIRNTLDKENKNNEKKDLQKMLNENLEKMKISKFPIFIEFLDKNREEDENKMLDIARTEIEKVIKKDEFFIIDFLKKRFQNHKTRN